MTVKRAAPTVGHAARTDAHEQWRTSRPARARSRWGAVFATLIASVLCTQTAAAGPNSHEADRHIAAPIAAVWARLADTQTWPAFTPGLKRIVDEPGVGNTHRARFEVQRLGIKVHYWVTIEMLPEQGIVRIDLDREGGSAIDALSTRWHLTSSPDGRATHVVLASHFRSGMPVPGFIEDRILRASIEATLDGLAQQVIEPTL